MLRGINRQTIFGDDEDNEKFLQVLNDCKKVCAFELYGYCLMGNHVHLLIREGKEDLASVFRRIGATYVYWYNRKYRRTGHLFQDRFRSETVENESYFAVVLRYIHQNPIKANLCNFLHEHTWSSYQDYIQKSAMVDYGFTFGIIDETSFVEFMEKDTNEKCLDNTGERKYLTDSELINMIERELNIKALMIQNQPCDDMERTLRRILEMDDVTTRQLARVTGVPVNTIWKL
jgi:REP element-mobilizing transposase RayT